MEVKKALQAGQVGLRELAEAAEVKYQTLRLWSAGTKTPRADNIRQVAKGFRKKSEELERIAGELDQVADKLNPAT